MYKFVVCDDDDWFCSELEQMIMRCVQEMNVQADIEIYNSGEILCRKLQEGNTYDVIFLDIELADLTGIDVGKYIREFLKDDKVIIVYVSAKEQYALQLFKVQPFDFLIKPIKYADVQELIGKVTRRIDKGIEYFEYAAGKNFNRVKLDEIVYFQSDKRKISLVKSDCKIEFYGNLSVICEKLPGNFIRIHKSYIVNYDYTKEFEYEWVKLADDQILSISKPYRRDVRARLLNKRR